MSHVLHCGDCLDPISGLPSLADKSVDHVLCDPPYSRDLYLRFRTNAPDGRQKSSPEIANMRIGAVDDVLAPVAAQMVRVARRWIVVFHDAESDHLWRAAFGSLYVRAGAWVKDNPTPQITGDRPAQGYEGITIAHAAGRKRWNGGGRPAIWYGSALNSMDRSRAALEHPCPKPLDLMEQLVRDFTDAGDLILDPFAGSGTTLVAARRLGRNAIGWEKDPKFHAAAVRRIDAAREQFQLPRLAKPRQLPLSVPGNGGEGA